MNDLISRSALINFAEFDAKVIAPYKHTAADILAMIVAAPAVDAVEVVRCYNCTQSERMSNPFGTVMYCYCWCKDVDYDGFCSHGERRTK